MAEHPSELLRAIHIQLGLESIYSGENETKRTVDAKTRRITALRKWSATLEDEDLREAYGQVLSWAEDTLNQWRQDSEHEDRARAVKLPPLPPELEP